MKYILKLRKLLLKKIVVFGTKKSTHKYFHPQGVTVWCALWSGVLYGWYFENVVTEACNFK